MKIPTLEQFTRTMTNGAGRPDRRFVEAYGNVSFEEAYPIYAEGIRKIFSQRDKIEAFEEFLISKGIECNHSNVSESRYYYYNGLKYRFSGHVYPTGSMSQNTINTVDFAADPEMIDNITF